MTRPLMTVELAEAYRPETVEEKVWILGIRGYSGDNKIGIYDDAIFLVTPKEVLGFNANTDPSRLLKGVASLVPGIYYYKKGLHGLSHLDLTKGRDSEMLQDAIRREADISNLTYWAYRQDSDVSVTRNGSSGTFTDNVKNRFWIDIHRGGYNTTSSAGCQTIHPDQWPEMKKSGYAAMSEYNESRIPYVLSLKK